MESGSDSGSGSGSEDDLSVVVPVSGDDDDEEEEEGTTVEHAVLCSEAAAYFPGAGGAAIESIVVRLTRTPEAESIPVVWYEPSGAVSVLVAMVDSATHARLFPNAETPAARNTILRLVDAAEDATLALTGQGLTLFAVERSDVAALVVSLLGGKGGALHVNTCTDGEATEDEHWEKVVPMLFRGGVRVSAAPPRSLAKWSPEARHASAERYERFVRACVAVDVAVEVIYHLATTVWTPAGAAFELGGDDAACVLVHRVEKPPPPKSHSVYSSAKHLQGLRVGKTVDEARTLLNRTLSKHTFASIARVNVDALALSMNPAVPSFVWEVPYLQLAHPWLSVARDRGSDKGAAQAPAV